MVFILSVIRVIRLLFTRAKIDGIHFHRDIFAAQFSIGFDWEYYCLVEYYNL